MSTTGVNYNLSNHGFSLSLPTSNAQPRMKISVIIPAHNEEEFLPNGLTAVAKAAEISPYEVETIVVLNRCTDRTEQIARNFGATIAREDAKNLARIRNAGFAASTGDIIVTVDADSRLHPHFLRIAVEKLQKNIIGGGAMVFPDRWSLGIICSGIAVIPYLAKYRLSFAAFWTTRKAFQAIDGFNPDFVTIEDVDFALRLRAHGRTQGKKWSTIWTAPLVTSCRKFDQYGDWHLVRDPNFLKRAFNGSDEEIANEYWYDQRS
jgi:glycosyltransferase involved in cell wall biosynthesis